MTGFEGPKWKNPRADDQSWITVAKMIRASVPLPSDAAYPPMPPTMAAVAEPEKYPGIRAAIRRDALARADLTRQAFLAAWERAAPFMTAEERAIDMTSTLNAMMQLMALPPTPRDAVRDKDGEVWR